MAAYIGVDVGGTQIRAGGMEWSGELGAVHREPTYQNVVTGEDLCRKIEGMVRRVPGWERAAVVGVGVPGAVDPNTGNVTFADNLTLLNGLPLKAHLERTLQKPVFLENDARAAALAEALRGAGAGKPLVCYLTISTGLGGGMVCNGRIYHGSANMGSYLCRMILDGENNCENLLSGTALCRQLKERTGRTAAHAGEVFDLYRAGDPAAGEIVARFRHNLRVLLMNLAVTLNPDVIVAGGGVMQARDCFWEDVVRDFRARVHPQAAGTAFAPAACREPGVLGACLLAEQGAESG